MRFLALLFLLIFTSAHAAENPSYSVPSVNVVLDIQEGDTLQTLRDRAVEQASKEALSTLMGTLVPTDAENASQTLTQNQKPVNMLQRFSIVREARAASYTLVVDLFFNRTTINRALTNAGIAFADIRPVRITVVPVLNMNGQKVLWGENPWANALKQALASGGNGVLIPTLAIADESLQQRLPADMAALGATDVLTELAALQGSDYAVVLQATLAGQGAAQKLTINSTWYGPENVSATNVFVPMENNSALEPWLTTGARQMLTNLENTWRQAGVVQADRPGRAFLRYVAKKPSDLEKLQLRISNLASVKKATWRLVSVRDSVLQVDYYGEPESLQATLQKNGFTVKPEGNLWRIIN